MGWIFVFPQNAYIEDVPPKMMVLGDGPSGKQTGLDSHEGGAPMMRLMPLQ